MDFCSTVWGRPANKMYTERMTKLQKRAARIILQCRISDFSSQEIFLQLKWMPFYERVSFKRSVLMYKCLNGLAPTYLHNFRYLSQQHTYSTRAAGSNNLATTRPRLSTYTRSFKFDGERLWNALPDDVRSARSTAAFKSAYCKSIFRV